MRQARIRAAREGRKLKEVVAEALELGLQFAAQTGHGAGLRVAADPGTGLPMVLAVQDAQGSRMSRAEILHLEQESQNQEDLDSAGTAP
jgi:hypothetical protein